jgi:hypothetical protein
VTLSPNELAADGAIFDQLCGLLSAADARLAAASAIASFYTLQKSRLYPQLAHHIGSVGAVLGDAAAAADMVATRPPFAVARLTLVTAESSRIPGDFERMNVLAAALLPGLLPAVVVASNYDTESERYASASQPAAWQVT